MSTVRIAAIVLIVAGISGLVFGTFGYIKETHKADLGSIQFSVQEHHSVNVPLWAGVGMIVLGGVLLVVPRKMS
jgi:hypothetical protein